MSKELSDLLPDFLSRKGDEIYYRFRGDEDISELWDEYLKEARENEYQLADEIGRLKAKLKEAEEQNEVYYNRGLRDAWLLADEQNKDNIIIPKWKFETIENALRMTNNIYKLHKKETAYQREGHKAYEYAQEFLNQQDNE